MIIRNISDALSVLEAQYDDQIELSVISSCSRNNSMRKTLVVLCLLLMNIKMFIVYALRSLLSNNRVQLL